MPTDNKALVALISKAGGASKFRKRYGAFKVELLEASYLSIVAYDIQDPSVIMAFSRFFLPWKEEPSSSLNTTKMVPMSAPNRISKIDP